jgi:uncharacterized C2H2 Zn-finger protein
VYNISLSEINSVKGLYMKCPKCEYEHGWNGEKLAFVVGEHGEFYTLSNNIIMSRTNLSVYNGVDYRELFACPVCGATFIEPGG